MTELSEERVREIVREAIRKEIEKYMQERAQYLSMAIEHTLDTEEHSQEPYSRAFVSPLKKHSETRRRS